MNIIFVKHGDKYSAEHVNKLYHKLMQYYPDADYLCYTDDPTGVCIPCMPVLTKPTLKFWWNKLALFSDALTVAGVKGKCLYFDLDMDIKEDPTSYIKWGGLNILNAYWKADMYIPKHAYDVRINSSIITWTAGEQTHIWNHFMSNKDYFMRKYAGIDRFLVHENIEFNTHEDGIVNSVANEFKDAPIDMYNGIEYDVERKTKTI